MIGSSKSGKINASINLKNEQNDIDKMYLYAKDLSEHEILIKNCEDVGTKQYNDPNAFIEYSSMVDDVYENIDDYKSNIKKNFNRFR